MNKITRKEIIIVGGGILLALVVLISFIYFTFVEETPPEAKPLPSSIPQSSVTSIPEPKIRISTKSAELVDQGKIEEVVKSLPYGGELIRLRYDDESQRFVLIYKRIQIEESRKELNEFLTRFGIPDWKMLDEYGMDTYFY